MNQVERVARALCLELGRCGDTEAVERNRVEGQWFGYVTMANDVIKALDITTPSAIITAQEKEIAALKAEILGMQRGINQSLGQMEYHTSTIRLAGCRLESALRRSRLGWENVIDLDMLPERHRPAANELIEDAAAALAEWGKRQ